MSPVVRSVITWYRHHGRIGLPWREPATTAWQVLMAEVMLAQTPVARVDPVYREWVARWPDASSLAATTPADVIRAWGRLGYPRRALRLREAAAIVARDYNGVPPADRDLLRALPGVGEYTSAAVLAFAHGRRVEVLDTNVRRVLARAISGHAGAAPSITAAERDLARELLPRRHDSAAEWSIAVMELGALVCTARRPLCGQCPIANDCAWLAAGQPVTELHTRSQHWEGTDRQCRGVIVNALRGTTTSLSGRDIAAMWPNTAQRERCIDSLLDDGLIDVTRGRYHLPR